MLMLIEAARTNLVPISMADQSGKSKPPTIYPGIKRIRMTRMQRKRTTRSFNIASNRLPVASFVSTGFCTKEDPVAFPSSIFSDRYY